MALTGEFVGLVQYKALFLAVFLSRILPDAGDKIQIDDFQLAGRVFNDHSAVIYFFNNAMQAAVKGIDWVDNAIFPDKTFC